MSIDRYIQTDKHIHILSQVLAKAGRSFGEKKDDDSHTSLTFDTESGRLSSQWLGTDKKIRLSLRLMDLCFMWHNGEECIQAVSTAKKNISEIEQQLCKGLKKSGMDEEGFTNPLHFEITDYGFNNHPVALLNRHQIDSWVKWRSFAQSVCSEVLAMASCESKIRIWPHHFDTAIYCEKEHHEFGFGLAVADSISETPYFYCSVYNDTRSSMYDLSSSEFYHSSDNFEGMILPLKEEMLKQESTLSEYMAEVENYII